MLKIDRNDPLDRMIVEELGGKPVLFDEWLDAMDELADDPDCEQILRERGLEREAVLREAQDYRIDFRARLAERGLPVYDRFALCRQLSEQAQEAPSLELLQIYCEILCDPGFLLGNDDGNEETILQYLDYLDEYNALWNLLLQRGELAGMFRTVKKQRRSPRTADCATERKYEVFRCFTELYDMPPKGDGRILLDNLTTYMQIAAASPELRSVEPLLLFRLLTRRQSYMCGTPDLTVNLSALWKADTSKVDADNGRNFKQYRTNLRLFADLCQIYEKDDSVNLPLCWYGLDQITVLGDFYRQKLSKGWSYIDGEDEIPFLPTIEEFVEDALFTCFEHGSGDNVLLMDSGLTVRELLDFQCSSHPLTTSVLNRLSDYMNDRAVELTNQFLQTDPSGVKELCRTVLEMACNGAIPSAQELPFLLASINEGLMELQDYFASQYLVQAGEALTREPLTGTPEPLG